MVFSNLPLQSAVLEVQISALCLLGAAPLQSELHTPNVLGVSSECLSSCFTGHASVDLGFLRIVLLFVAAWSHEHIKWRVARRMRSLERSPAWPECSGRATKPSELTSKDHRGAERRTCVASKKRLQ